MKKMLKSTGLVCPHLSRKFTYLMLLLVTLIGGANSAWAEDYISNFTGLTTSSATISDTYGSLSGGTWNNSSYSFSNEGTFTVTANSGYVVKDVTITYSASDNNRVGGTPAISDNTNYAYSRDNAIGTITCNGTAQNSVGITMTNSARIIAVSVTWSDATGGDTPQPSVYDFSMLYPTSGTTPSSVSDLTVTGGSLSVNGDGVSFDSKGIKLGKNSDNIKVTLSEKSIIPGTVIEISYKSAYSDGTTSGVGVFDGAGNNQTINESVASDASGTFTYTFTEESAANYDKEFTITRNGAGKSVYITGITVANAGQKIYKVTFDAGVGGTCSTESLTEESAGVGVTLPGVTNNDGYKFIGWSTSSNPTSADAGTAGATYNPSGNCTLYAYYTELLPATVSVTGGGTYNVGDDITLTGSATPANGATIKGMYGKDNAKPYRWYTCNADGSGATPIPSQQESTYSPSSATPGTYYFRFMARESDGTTWYKSTLSDVVTVVVNGIVPTITPSETAVDVEIENTKEITLSSPSTGAYSVSSSNEGKLTASVEGSTITLTPAGKGTATGVTITITQAANGIYSEAQTTITANVVKHSMSAPTISCVDNVVTITPAVDGAFVYYSIDGNDPVEDEAHKYTEPFTIDADCTVKAFAKANDYNDSPIASQDVTYVAPASDPTKVGAEDNSSAYNSVHSEVKELAVGMTRHIEFKNYSDKGQNWNNWILNVGTTTEKAKSPDVMQLRADSYDVLDNANTGKADNFNWSTFKNDMDGATVAMDVTNSGKHIYVNATITTANGTEYKYSAISSDKLADATAYICLTVEKAHLTDLNIGDEAQAYELTYAMNELGTSTYNDSYGKVTIKNAQGLALRKGTYVPSGEVVKYKAENFDDPRYVFVKWASGYTDAERDITVAEAAVNPCAVFLDKPGVTTPENIVTLSHPAIGTDGFKMYFTLDNSDPKTSASRYEYSASNLVAIRENIGKVRAVAYIDGVYSVIQGTNVTYEPVTVLEARGGAVDANSTFTGNTNTTTVKFGNNVTDSWTNAKSPNSSVDVDEKVYRGQDSKFTIGLNSTSAYKFVIGYTSGGSSERGLTDLSVDGNSSTYTSNGVKANSQTEVKRLVISPTSEIEQGSEVTFTFGGNVGIAYIEVFGTSLEQCESPTIAPYQYDATDGWSYQIIPVEGTTLNYTVNGGAVQTSTSGSTVTIAATDIATAQTIVAWSTKDGWGGSTRTKFTDAEAIEPVLKFSPSATATYNKAIASWVGGVAPTLNIYPIDLITSVTYATDDANVGKGTNGTSTISIGDGQGVATITASVTLAAENGLKAGTYTKALKLTLADGYAQQLGASETPEVQGKRYVYDDQGNKILTLTYGGWNHGAPSDPTNWTAGASGGTAGKDRWPAPKDDPQLTPIDGYKYNSQMACDARDEIKGKVDWQSNIDGNDYTKVNPFSMPCRGAYITVVPECNGQLTIYLVQNGCVDANGNIVSDPYSRVYYWYDEDGDVIPPTSVTIKGKVKEGRKRSDYQTTINAWLSNITSDQVRTKLSTDINTGWPDEVGADKHPIPYCGGYFLPEKDYVKYVVQLVAGRTYYFFSNGSKMGYSGLNFAPTADGSITIQKPEGGNMTITTKENLALSQNTAFVAPSDMTTYKSITLDRKFAAETWNTICLPFHVSEDRVKEIFGDGTQLIIYDGMDGKTAKFKYHVHQDILAGQAYFIKPTKEIETNTLEFNNVTIKNGQSVYNNGSDGSDGSFSFVGTFAPTQINAYDHYTNAAGNITYFQNGSTTMPGYRAYLRNNTGNSNGAKVISGIQLFNAFDDLDDDAVTGIMEVIINDMHAVYKPSRGVYNLSGVKVGDTTEGLPAGIYIMDGRKVSIK